MAGIQARSYPFFRISPAEPDKAQSFAVKRGGLATRIDAKHYSLREILNSSFPLVELRELVRTEPDYGLSSRALTRTSEDEPRYIRITDFGEDGIEDDNEFVTADPVDLKYELSADDLLFARSGGTVGKTYLHEDASELAIFAGYCIRFRFDESKVSPKFVYWWTKTSAYSRWVNAIKRPTAQTNINKEEFKSCSIPLPPIAEQNRLIIAMDVARAERKAKLAEADALLAGLDDFLLDTLGITPPPKDNRRVFAVSLASPRALGRLDSDYYHPERIGVLLTLRASSQNLSLAHIAEVACFERNQIRTPEKNYLSLAHVESQTGELTDTTDTASGICFTFQTDDVLFSRLRPYLNKVHRAKTAGCCSPEFHVLRIKDRKALLPEYLAAVLRSSLVLAQTTHMMTGNIHPHLASDDVANLLIPIPELKVQEAIAAETQHRQERSRGLRAEAETGWQAAKRWFEEQLLGTSSS